MQGIDVLLGPLLLQSDSQQLSHYLSSGENVQARKGERSSGVDHAHPSSGDLLGDTEAHLTWSDPAYARGQDFETKLELHTKTSKQNFALEQQESDNSSMEARLEPAEARYSDRVQKTHTTDYLRQATLPPSCQSGDQEGTADEAKHGELRSDGMHLGVRESQPETKPLASSGFELPGSALTRGEGILEGLVIPAQSISYSIPMKLEEPLPPENSAHAVPMLSSSASTRSSLRSFQSLALRLSKGLGSTKSSMSDRMSITTTSSSWSFGRVTGYAAMDIEQEDSEKMASSDRTTVDKSVYEIYVFAYNHGRERFCPFTDCVDERGNRMSKADMKRRMSVVHANRIYFSYFSCGRRGAERYIPIERYGDHLWSSHGYTPQTTLELARKMEEELADKELPKTPRSAVTKHP